jgi:hypothetical protein
MLVSKILTYLSDKLRLKIVITKKPAIFVVSCFRGRFLKSYGAEKKFSMLVQDSKPIDTTIAKC